MRPTPIKSGTITMRDQEIEANESDCLNYVNTNLSGVIFQA